MIARVRIAPVERWCEYYSSNIIDRNYIKPGMDIQIIAESCAIDPPELDLDGHPPGFKWWRIPGEFVASTGRPQDHCYICEHMLEMD